MSSVLVVVLVLTEEGALASVLLGGSWLLKRGRTGVVDAVSAVGGSVVRRTEGGGVGGARPATAVALSPRRGRRASRPR